MFEKEVVPPFKIIEPRGVWLIQGIFSYVKVGSNLNGLKGERGREREKERKREREREENN